MGWKCILFAIAVAICNNAAFAAAPKLSGDYLLSMTILCQGGLKVTKNAQYDIKDISPAYSARLETDIGDVTFNNVTKKITGTGFTVFGETLQVQGVSGAPTNMHEKSTALNFSYSNIETTFTLGSEVFRVFYGKVINGIAQAAVFQRFGGNVSPNQHCAMQGQLIRK